MIKKIDLYIDYLLSRETPTNMITGLVAKKFGIIAVVEYRKSGSGKFKI